jgi:Tfp pilus assembly protein PilF
MKWIFSLLLALAAPLPASAQPVPPAAARSLDPAAEDALIERAATLIQERKPAEAIALLDQVIAAEETAHKGETRRVYSSRGPAETLLYMVQAAAAKQEAIAAGPQWGLATFLKGFALIDLGSAEAAGPLLARAAELSPANSQYLAEFGEWHKSRRDWAQAYAWFEKAEGAAALSPPHSQTPNRTRALRGMGFALIEQGKLDEAAKAFKKCLELDPNDAGAKQELDYIRGLRRQRV